MFVPASLCIFRLCRHLLRHDAAPIRIGQISFILQMRYAGGVPQSVVTTTTQCEFPRRGTSRVTTVTLVPREGNETLRLIATPITVRALASSQIADVCLCQRPFVSSGYAVIYYVMTQHQSGLDRFHSCFRCVTLGAFP